MYPQNLRNNVKRNVCNLVKRIDILRLELKTLKGMFDQRTDRTLKNWHFILKISLVSEKCKEYRSEIPSKCHNKLLKVRYHLFTPNKKKINEEDSKY